MKGYQQLRHIHFVNHVYPDDCPDCGEVTAHEVIPQGYSWCRNCGKHREGPNDDSTKRD